MRSRTGGTIWSGVLCAAAIGLLIAGCGDSSFFADSGETAPVVEPPEQSSSNSTEGGDETSESDPPESNPERPGVAVRVDADRDRFSARAGLDPATELPPELYRPIQSWLTVDDEVAVENLLDRPVPFVAHVYVHSGGVLLGRVQGGSQVDGLPPGESRFMPAPKESPERAMQSMKRELVDHGFSEKRADELMDERGRELFREHGARAIYIAPQKWVQSTGSLPLGAVQAPVPPWRQ